MMATMPESSGPPVKDGQMAKSAFSQQKLKTWRPLCAPGLVIGLTLGSGAVFYIIGAVIFVAMRKQIEVDTRYDDVCDDSAECNVTISLAQPITKTTTVLSYRLTNYHQNHLRYFKSRSYAQLAGGYLETKALRNDCGSFLYAPSLNDSVPPASRDDFRLLPCGAVALSFFNDTYTWLNPGVDQAFSDGNIAWRSDRQKLFAKLNGSTRGIRWMDDPAMNETFPAGPRNEHFIVWMRDAVAPNFMKPFAKCPGCFLASGEYVIQIENNYRKPDGSPIFNGEKHIVLSTVGLLGSRNMPLAYCYLALASFLTLSGLVIIATLLFCSRPLGQL
jgi:hypothetical protein